MYRPSCFSEVLGQRHVIKFFEVVLGRYFKEGTALPVGALFGGHSGVGKTTLARVISASLNCQKRNGIEPCGECPNCRQIIQGLGGVMEIDASFFGLVDNIRQLRERLGSYSFQDYQVVILDECHMLSREASNVLLKLFEEPPSNVFFVLCTTEVEKLLETVRSRVVEFRFSVIPADDVVKYLQKILDKEGVTCADEIIKDLYFMNRNVRDVLVALEQLSIISKSKIGEKHVDELYGDIKIYDKLIDALKSGRYADALDMYDKHELFRSDFNHLVTGIIIRVGDRFREALKSGGGDFRWYGNTLRTIYEFMTSRISSMGGSAAARLLFEKLLPEGSPKVVAAPTIVVKVSDEEIFKLLTDGS